MGKEIFYPNCKKEKETGLWKCNPVLKKSDMELTTEEPVVIKVEPDGGLEYLKYKGCPEEVMDRLEKHFKKRTKG